MSLVYYDGSGTIAINPPGLSLVDDFEETAAVLVSLALCDDFPLGALQTIQLAPGLEFPRDFPLPDLRGCLLTVDHNDSRYCRSMTLELRNLVCSEFLLGGRQRFIYTAFANGRLKDQTVMVKLLYQAKSRKRGEDLLQRARRAGVDHLVELHASVDLWSL